MKYRFREDFLFQGTTYYQGEIYDLSPEIIAALPSWVAEQVVEPPPTKSKKEVG